MVSTLKRNWAGHVYRMTPNRWAKIATEWVQDGRQERGRPRRSWRKTSTHIVGDWSEVALDRKVWQKGGCLCPAVGYNTG